MSEEQKKLTLDFRRDSGAPIREQLGTRGLDEYVNLKCGDLAMILDRMARLEAEVRSLQNQRPGGLSGAELPASVLSQIMGNGLTVQGSPLLQRQMMSSATSKPEPQE